MAALVTQAVRSLRRTGKEKEPDGDGDDALLLRGNTLAALAAAPFHTAIKITENESPRPQNRVFVAYNFFSNVDRGVFQFPGGVAPDLHRELVGFERAFMDNNASIGLRLPVFQLVGNDAVQDSQIGSLSIIFKYAFYNNLQTGSLMSTGMVLSTPTGRSVQVPGESSINPVIFQPFLGYIYNTPNWYLQGFSAIQVPSDARDITILTNDFAMGYWLYRDNDSNATLTGIVPDVELHVNDPLTHRGITDFPLGFTDTVDVTAGSYFIFRRAIFGVAVGVPLTGPKPYDVEAIANLNIRY
jgi:hypothetical protein